MFITRVLENSAVVQLIKKVSSGSRLLALGGSLLGTTRRIIVGSRVVSFFKVGDYLDADSRPLVSLVKNAENYRRISTLVVNCNHRIRSWRENLHLDQSEVVTLTARLKQQREEFLSRRNILFFGLAFLSGFYILRFLLLAFIPESDFRISWSAGLLLTLILIVVLLQLAPKNNSSSSAGSGAGITQNAGRVFVRLAVKAGRSVKFIIETVSKFFQGGKSGGNHA